MNKLPLATRTQIRAMLREGSSIRSISRVAEVSINTVSKLLVEAGLQAAWAIQEAGGMMHPWNKDYALEASAIAATIVEEQGQHWLAEQIRRGKQPHRMEIRIAMRALMVARGEIELKRPYV